MPDRNTLSTMRKKPNESFREYAIKWREQEARVKPPLDEQELVDIFIEAQDPNYFHHLTAAMGRPFHTAIKIGEIVESGLKTGRIVSQAAIKDHTVSPSPYTVFNAQSYVHSPNRPHFRALTQGNLRPQRPPYQVPYNPLPMQHYAQEQGQKRKFPPLGESYSSLFQKLRKIRVIGSISPHRLNPTSLGFQANERCKYHSRALGHNTDNCWTLKGAIDKLIDHRVVVVTDDQNTPNVTNNPLLAQNNLVGMICDDQEYKLLGKMGKLFRKIEEENNSIKILEPVASLSVEGVNLDTKVLCVSGVSKGIEVRATDSKAVPWNYNKIAVVYRGKEIFEEVDETGRLTRSGRCYSPEELRKGKMTQNIQVPPKKAVTEEEAEEFLKKIKVPDYSVVEQLKKTPAQISLLSLLLHSKEHRRVLNKILNEAHGDGHNRALLLTVKCEGYYVKRVMIDGGSRVDICPLSTLQNLKISLNRSRPSNIFVRAYDGSRWDTIGEIKLNMTIGPVDFMIVFQVMDMDTSYNFLLGRPWIHMARAVPSTLHQVVKFEHNHQEIIVHGEDDLPIYIDPSIPYIEAKEGCESIIYQSFEAVSVDRFREVDPTIQPCLSSSYSMIGTTMLKYGCQPGIGLGLCSQGIVDLITLLGNQGTSGLRYKQIKRNGDETKNHKRTD
ncbi:uncharacterized protein LOC125865510 [Solanum stenotomum]|uniref:uncharacterized protein LOC125865510 n=1 Tax=Solanum stenotomum TaxID=172797 RepID=UPI0020D1CD47|nr:uncharacterized protein LOC125865510 [Solanum stenotomum]